MSVQNRETLKGYFIKGAMPNQDQFSDLIDSMAAVSDNKITLSPGTPYYEVADLTIITLIWFIGATSTDIGVGYTEVDNDVFEVGHMPSETGLPFMGCVPLVTGRRIYFNGIQPDTKIIILKY